MQELPVCPRCQFRLPPGGHLCRTCGYVVPAKKGTAGEPVTEQKQGWSNVFKLNSAKEKRHDETALGET